MKQYNVCKANIIYNMGSEENACEVMYDLAEAPLIYDPEVRWTTRTGEEGSLQGDDFLETMPRKSFQLCVSIDHFAKFAITGWSDGYHERKVTITWNPQEDVNLVVLTLHSGYPAKSSERQLIDIIQNAWPGLPESRDNEKLPGRQRPEEAGRLHSADFDSLTDAEKIVLMEEFEKKGKTMDFSNFVRVEGHREPAGCHCYMFADVIDSRGSRGERFLGECGVRFTDVTRMDPNEHGYALTCCMVPENDMTAFRVAMEHLKAVTTKEDDVYPIYCQLMLRYT